MNEKIKKLIIQLAEECEKESVALSLLATKGDDVARFVAGDLPSLALHNFFHEDYLSGELSPLITFESFRALVVEKELNIESGIKLNPIEKLVKKALEER